MKDRTSLRKMKNEKNNLLQTKLEKYTIEGVLQDFKQNLRF